MWFLIVQRYSAVAFVAVLTLASCGQEPGGTFRGGDGGDVGDPGDVGGEDPELDVAFDVDNPDGTDVDAPIDAGDFGRDVASDVETDIDPDTADDTSDDTSDDADLLDVSDGEEDAEEVCLTTICGPTGVCCSEDTECVLDTCLPACASGVRCGESLTVCCEADFVCLEQACTALGGGCIDSYDCPEGEFCEPTLNRCLPQPEEVTCQVVPVFDDIEVEVEWSVDNVEIISIPLVGDLDGDDLPEVVVNVSRAGADDWAVGEIMILEGSDGSLVRRLSHDPDAAEPVYGSHGRSTAGIGDLTGDGLPDIVYAGRRETGAYGPIHAVDGEGNWLFTAFDSDGNTVLMHVENGAATLANFDDDPETEIVFGASLIDHTGLVVWNYNDHGSWYGTNATYAGGISAVADLDGDDVPEIISGRHAWKVDWTPGATSADPPTVVVTSYWEYGDDSNDGYPAVADLDGDGIPEVVLVSNQTVRVLNGQTGELWCGRDPTGVACESAPADRTQPLVLRGEDNRNRGGPPTIADFDGDGLPEIGIAGGWAYSVYDVNRPDEEIVQPDGDSPPDPGAIYVRWSQPTKDHSSNATGSSVFDFQGDGAAEVVYADECYMRVYSGTDGTIQLELPNSTATIHEYPLVVDIDGDNNSELVIVANLTNATGNCDITDYVGRQGLYVYGGPDDDWVRTRRVWTQHAYHVTNATSSGNVPFEEADNWTIPGLNNYRQNVQGEGVFNAADLTVELSASVSGCHAELLRLQARVGNQGSIGVPAGLTVTFYNGTDATGTLLGEAVTDMNLLPGMATQVILDVPAPPENVPIDYFVTVAGEEVGVTVECEPDNNSDQLPWLFGCPKG